MARHANVNWDLDESNRTHSIDTINAALLMDLRDELRRMNNLLETIVERQLMEIKNKTKPIEVKNDTRQKKKK